MNEQLTIYQPFEVPKGNLFYPSCGVDTLTALSHFYQMIDHFYFSDIYRIGLPNWKELMERPSFIEPLEELPFHVVDHSLKALSHQTNLEIMDSRRPFYERLQTMNHWLYTETIQTELNQFHIGAYLQDSLLVFDTIDSLATFFYRGDSMLELGSGVKWLGPALFDQIVDKLIDGGLIITDGSNPDASCLETPWQPLYQHSHYAFPDLKDGERPDNFIYRNRMFQCVGALEPRYGDTYIWQVNYL